MLVFHAAGARNATLRSSGLVMFFCFRFNDLSSYEWSVSLFLPTTHTSRKIQDGNLDREKGEKFRHFYLEPVNVAQFSNCHGKSIGIQNNFYCKSSDHFDFGTLWRLWSLLPNLDSLLKEIYSPANFCIFSNWIYWLYWNEIGVVVRWVLLEGKLDFNVVF